MAGGAVVWVVLLFVYYAGYDLGYRADVVLVGLAVVVALIAVTGAPPAGPAYRPSPLVLGGVAVVALLLAALGPALTLRPVATDARPERPPARRRLQPADGLRHRRPLRRPRRRPPPGRSTPTWSCSARSTAAGCSTAARTSSACSRGCWTCTPPSARRPTRSGATPCSAATPLRGNDSHAFDSYGAVTGAQALTATFTWRGRAVTVISTHLQPGADGTDDTVGQAKELAGLMTAANRGGRSSSPGAT